METNDEEPSNTYLIGRITNFAYLKQKGLKNFKYSSNHACIQGNKNDIGVCGWWYSIENDVELIISRKYPHGYIDIKNYILTIPNPKIEEGKVFITQETSEQMHNLI